MLNRRSGALALALIAGALAAASTPAQSCGWNGCSSYYGYGYGYGPGGYNYAQPAYYAQTTYYYAQPTYYQPPVYPQPSYYNPCCRGPSLWDSLFGSNCCVSAYQPPASPWYGRPIAVEPYGYGGPYGYGYGGAGYAVGGGSLYAGVSVDPGMSYAGYGPAAYDPYVAPAPRYAYPRRHYYRHRYRPYAGYRARVVVTSPRWRPYYRTHRPRYYVR